MWRVTDKYTVAPIHDDDYSFLQRLIKLLVAMAKVEADFLFSLLVDDDDTKEKDGRNGGKETKEQDGIWYKEKFWPYKEILDETVPFFKKCKYKRGEENNAEWCPRWSEGGIGGDRAVVVIGVQQETQVEWWWKWSGGAIGGSIGGASSGTIGGGIGGASGGAIHGGIML